MISKSFMGLKAKRVYFSSQSEKMKDLKGVMKFKQGKTVNIMITYNHAISI